MSNLIKSRTRTAFLEEDKNGDLVFTFSAEELKLLGVKEGEWVDFRVVNGTLHIKKASSKRNPKMSSKIIKAPKIAMKKKRPTKK
jgi:hypothetical protein